MNTRVDAKHLSELVEQFQPASLLAVGPAGESLFTEYLHKCPQCRLAQFDAEHALCDIPGDARYDLGLVSHSLEFMSKPEAGRLVARLRDIHCRRLIVVVPIGRQWQRHRSHWHTADMLGYGLVRIAQYRHEDRPVHIYAFDIDTYKLVPDWLNSRYWAHPELFDKYWW